jgi:DNA invertase Pin-like site-specific DNA recombinase
MTPHGAKVRAGQERARRERGKLVGRPRNATLTPDVVRQARAMLDDGMRWRDVAAALHVPVSTLHRALHREVTP